MATIKRWQMEEVKQITENAPSNLEDMAKLLGVTPCSLKRMIELGKLYSIEKDE